MKIIQAFMLILSLFALQGCGKSKEVSKEKVGDIELAYYTRGQGDPMVLIMGFRGTMALWDPALLEELEKKYTLILFDNRGVGFSEDAGIEPLTIAQMAQDTVKLIIGLGYQRAHVLGWSMGSRIALDMALKYPDRVETLILCAPNPGGRFQVQRKGTAYEALTGKALTEKAGLALIFPDSMVGKRAAESYAGRLRSAIYAGTVPDDLQITEQAIQKQIGALKLWDENNNLYEELPTIRIPTLVAGGLADVLDEPENVQIVASRIPFAWSAFFPGAGHNFLSQDYHRFASLVDLFIETNTK